MSVFPPIQRPDVVDGKLFSSNVSVFLVIHCLALLALIPYLFSWTGVVLVFVGNYIYVRMVGLVTDVVTPDLELGKKLKSAAIRSAGPLAPDVDPDHDILNAAPGPEGRIDAAHALPVPPPHRDEQEREHHRREIHQQG